MLIVDRIETQRLVLRPPVYTDGPALHALLSDPIACHFSPSPLVSDLAVTRFTIVEWHEGRQRGLQTFVLTRIDNPKRPIGFISIGPDEELGGLLSPNETGQGLASEALRGVIETLGLQLAWTIIDADHHALIATLSRVNIVPEERLPAYRVHPQISDQKRDCVLLR